MILRLGDDGVVSSVDEEELVYTDKKELEQFIESYKQLEKENEELKEYKELAVRMESILNGLGWELYFNEEINKYDVRRND